MLSEKKLSCHIKWYVLSSKQSINHYVKLCIDTQNAFSALFHRFVINVTIDRSKTTLTNFTNMR